MFWDTSYTASPHLEDLLAKEDVTLQELLDDAEILTEYKTMNKALVAFFHRKDIIEELITLITVEPPAHLNDVVRFKHPNIACEILTAETPDLTECIIENQSVLEKLFSFLEQEPPLNPLLTSFFSKTFGNLIVKKSEQNWFSYQCVCVQVLEFIKMRERFLDTIFKHIGTPAIMDLLFQIITNVEGDEMKTNLFDWLKQQRLIPRLINILGCDAESEKHNNVAQFICDIITHWRSLRQSDMCVWRSLNDPSRAMLSAIEDGTITQGLLEIILSNATSESTVVAGIKIIVKLLEVKIFINERDPALMQSVTEAEEKHRLVLLSKLLPQISSRVKDFYELLVKPPKKATIQNTVELLSPPFGNTRLQICIMLSVLLQSGNSGMEKAICETDFFVTLLNLFKQYCWNNLLHNQVKVCLMHSLTPPSDSQISALQQHVISNSKIVSKLIDCWMHNREKMQATKKKGSRLGYMGQLIAVVQVVNTHYGANEAYRALIDASLDEEDRKSWAIITNAMDGELPAELALQERFLAGLDPYAKNENDYSSSMNIIDEEAGMEPEAFERFQQIATVQMSSIEDMMSNMCNIDMNEWGSDDDDFVLSAYNRQNHLNDDDDEDDDDENGGNGGGAVAGGNRDFHDGRQFRDQDIVILEASDDNANVHSVDKLKETESIFNFYNSQGSVRSTTNASSDCLAAVDAQSGAGEGFADFQCVFGNDGGVDPFETITTLDDINAFHNNFDFPAITKSKETSAMNSDEDVPFSSVNAAVVPPPTAAPATSLQKPLALPSVNGPACNTDEKFMDQSTTTTPSDLKMFTNELTTTNASANAIESHANGPI